MTELEPKLNYPFPTGDFITLGGLIHQRLGRIAITGDIVELEGAQLTVMEMDKHRITRVLFEVAWMLESSDDAGEDPIDNDQYVFAQTDSIQRPEDQPIVQLAYNGSGGKKSTGSDKTMRLKQDAGA